MDRSVSAGKSWAKRGFCRVNGAINYGNGVIIQSKYNGKRAEGEETSKKRNRFCWKFCHPLSGQFILLNGRTKPDIRGF